MATVTQSKKACAVNPLKMSAPLGASYAFLGIDKTMPLMHGAQGCTSFGLVLLVRHFKETIPLQTTAMNEVTTILGGLENLEQAIVNIYNRAKPALIGICSTGLTETKGDDVEGYLTLIREAHPELAETALVYVSTPDYVGAFQDGFAKAIEAIARGVVEPAAERALQQVNILAGAHLTAGDIEEIRDLVESFGLTPIILPDVSGSLDGHIPETFLPTTLGGTRVEDIRRMGASALTLAIGEQMRPAAVAIEERAGVPYRVFDRLTGMVAVDAFVATLMEVSGRAPSARLKRERSRLQDTMLDAHFHTGGKKIAIGAEPDLLYALAQTLADMGARIPVAVTTTTSPVLERMPCDEVLIGDLEDFEWRAKECECDLLITHSHGRQAAERTGIPLMRMGLPLFDRIGSQHTVSVGYRGTRDFLIAFANQMLDHMPHYHANDWPLSAQSQAAAAPVRGRALKVPVVAAGTSGASGACGNGSCSCGNDGDAVVALPT